MMAKEMLNWSGGKGSLRVYKDVFLDQVGCSIIEESNTLVCLNPTLKILSNCQMGI